MNRERVAAILDDAEAGTRWLESIGVADPPGALSNLHRIARDRLSFDLIGVIFSQLAACLPRCADPDMAINHLERYFEATRNRLGLAALFERDPRALPTLVQIFSNSEHLAVQLAKDPESFDILRMTEGRPLARRELVEEITAEVENVDHDVIVMRRLRRFKYRETLRIAYGDIIRDQGLRTVTRQISFLADALIEAALRAAWRSVAKKRGDPRTAAGDLARIVVLALGKLGGVELNYSSDIDLIVLYDEDGYTDGRRPVSNSEFFAAVTREMSRLLSERTDMGAAYRVDFRLRPDGARGPLVISTAAATNYYELRGRTWERQAFIKARPVAGSLKLGFRFLDELRSWIYRRYLGHADITGIKALKRRIDRRTKESGADVRDVKTGHGGIRDVEFVIQFLQLLNGADLPAVRTGNTLDAIAKLENVGCLSNLERTLLEENYTFLRNIEHRLQIMFDLQTHSLPGGEEELRKLALRMGYRDKPERTALDAFTADCTQKRELNRKMLDHLLHDAFEDEEETRAEVDLVLDPKPSEEHIREVLGKHRFHDPLGAYQNLMALSEEKIRFLSTRRCRLFLASIAPQLLETISKQPDPDSTLVNLDHVSASLGGKGALWELFSFNPPSLRLYVELCANSPYLCSILTSNPGMIDGLMDSLVQDHLLSRAFMGRLLDNLCRSAENLDPILHSFKNDQQLRVGVRDLLGKEGVRNTTRALSNIAEVCIQTIAREEYRKLVESHGRPIIGEGSAKRRKGKPCEFVILAMGKFGGRELNYHSDLDMVFLYEADGTTEGRDGAGARSTTNQHFFSQLGQRIIKTACFLGPQGRLYEVDVRLRPTGKSGPLAVPFGAFARYFSEGTGQLWERQALCRARVVFGEEKTVDAALAAVHKAAFGHRWRKKDAQEIRHMRTRMEQGADRGNIKTGPGGIVDVEFLVQMLQLKHAKKDASLRHPNMWSAMKALYNAGHFSADDYEFFFTSYQFLRGVETRLQLMNSTARNVLPSDRTELDKLAHLMNYPGGQAVVDALADATGELRRRFEGYFEG